MKTVSGSAVLEEFDLDKAKALAGSDISLSACVHKVNDMGAFYFFLVVVLCALIVGLTNWWDNRRERKIWQTRTICRMA